MAVELDFGPPRWFAEHFSRVPDYPSRKEDYGYDWGPVFYRVASTAARAC